MLAGIALQLKELLGVPHVRGHGANTRISRSHQLRVDEQLLAGRLVMHVDIPQQATVAVALPHVHLNAHPPPLDQRAIVVACLLAEGLDGPARINGLGSVNADVAHALAAHELDGVAVNHPFADRAQPVAGRHRAGAPIAVHDGGDHDGHGNQQQRSLQHVATGSSVRMAAGEFRSRDATGRMPVAPALSRGRE